MTNINLNSLDELTPQQMAAVQDGLDDIKAGRVVPANTPAERAYVRALIEAGSQAILATLHQDRSL